MTIGTSAPDRPPEATEKMLDDDHWMPRLPDLGGDGPYPLGDHPEWLRAALNLPTGWYWQAPFALPSGGWIVVVYNVAGAPGDSPYVVVRAPTKTEALESLAMEFEGYQDHARDGACRCRWLRQ
jgi:hypothetical protein